MVACGGLPVSRYVDQTVDEFYELAMSTWVARFRSGTTRKRQTRSAPMVIVAGHITVESHQRESYLAGCVNVVEQARRATGCLDFTITADLLDPGRINIFERWESQAAVETFRSSGPSKEQGAAMLSASVAEYDIADVRPLFGEGTG
jgi:quinol monooxygenase YgiN